MDRILSLKSLLQLVYPHYCPACYIIIPIDHVVCRPCLYKIKATATLHLAITQKYRLCVYAASTYDGVAQTLLLKKFSRDSLASKQLARLMISLIDFDRVKPDYLVPVPLHWSRYAQRGFNQAAVMAHELGSLLNIPVINALKRSRKTAYQSTLNKQERELNVAGAFALNDWYGLRNLHHLEGKRIVLVDDLCTSGVTLIQAGKVLRLLNPESIDAVVACRAA